jgi:hypothetical protein
MMHIKDECKTPPNKGGKDMCKVAKFTSYKVAPKLQVPCSIKLQKFQSSRKK